MEVEWGLGHNKAVLQVTESSLGHQGVDGISLMLD
jgi:hypothetical protein